jgi:hypothetical protein
VFNRMPGSLDFIVVGSGYNDGCHPYEVWGLNSSAQIFRFNFCATNWDQIPGTLQTISVGGGDVWGINGNGDLFQFNFGTNSFEFFDIADIVLQVAVGPEAVWVITGSSKLVNLIPGDQIGPIFDPTPLAQVRAGGDGVFGIDSNGSPRLLRYAGLTFAQITGVGLASISVGSGGGVWGIDSAGLVYAFSTP